MPSPVLSAAHWYQASTCSNGKPPRKPNQENPEHHSTSISNSLPSPPWSSPSLSLSQTSGPSPQPHLFLSSGPSHLSSPSGSTHRLPAKKALSLQKTPTSFKSKHSTSGDTSTTSATKKIIGSSPTT